MDSAPASHKAREMGRASWSDQWALAHGHATDSVIRVGALEKLGMDRTTIYRRCRPTGPWQLLLPGVVSLASGTPTDRQRLHAAVLFGGSDALLTGHVAARLHGLQGVGANRFVQLLVPHDQKRRCAGFVLVERTTRLPSRLRRESLPCVPVLRAVLDTARRLRDPRAVQALLAEAVQRGRCTPRQLRDELDAGSQRGTALVRAALPEIASGARSVAEAEALRLWRRAGLPEAQWNVQLVTPTGKLIATPDAWAPQVGLAWEIDSYDYHFTRLDYARTLERNARYSAHGIAYLQTIPSRLTDDADNVISELHDSYAAAERRPLPDGICWQLRRDDR